MRGTVTGILSLLDRYCSEGHSNRVSIVIRRYVVRGTVTGCLSLLDRYCSEGHNNRVFTVIREVL